MRLGALAILLSGLSMQPLTAAVKPCSQIQRNVSDVRFTPGQVWTYAARSSEPASTFTILEIDRSEKLGIIVHVRVDGLALRAPNGRELRSIEHMPFTRDALLMSVVRLSGQVKQMPTMEGYDRWASDCGGVYTISVAEAVEVAEETFNAP